MELSPDQRAILRDSLRLRYVRLLGEIRTLVTQDSEHPYAELADVPDPGDASVADLLIDIDNAMVHRDVEEIRAIERAQERLREGDYGICTDCGLDIDYARLQANPTAQRCLICQDHFEKTHTHDRPTL